MAVVTSQQLNTLYEKFKQVDVTFTKEVAHSLGLISKFVYLKHRNGHLPCIIYSSSMTGARVLANLDDKIIQNLSEQGNNISLRYSFKDSDKSEPMNFFVPAHIEGINKYKENPSLYFLSLIFTQRPPNDLVQILGSTLDAVNAASLRKEERIVITSEVQRILTLENKNTTIFIDQIPRNAILRDLSFSGAKVIILGNAKFLVNKPFVLNINTKSSGTFSIPGKIVRHEEVEGRRDICALALLFVEEKVPVKYKMLLNSYFQTQKKHR